MKIVFIDKYKTKKNRLSGMTFSKTSILYYFNNNSTHTINYTCIFMHIFFYSL